MTDEKTSASETASPPVAPSPPPPRCCCGIENRATALFAAAVAAIALGGLLFAAGYHFLNQDRTAMPPAPLPALADIAPESWQALSEKTIFFGHQSVGRDLMNGVAAVTADVSGLDVNRIDLGGPDIAANGADVGTSPALAGPALAHGRLGRNRYPLTKIEGLRNLLDSGLAERVDLAGIKLCYVDILRESEPDPEALFRQYKAVFDDLEARYPSIRFFHLTVPLTTSPPGVRSNLRIIARRLLGRATWVEDNLPRQVFNVRMRETYGPSGNLFDIALVESIDPWGRQRLRKAGDGTVVPVMWSGYSHDGGHLNTLGRRRVGEQFLIALARMAGER